MPDLAKELVPIVKKLKPEVKNAVSWLAKQLRKEVKNLDKPQTATAVREAIKVGFSCLRLSKVVMPMSPLLLERRSRMKQYLPII
jgi:hypothetical protein